MAVASAPATGKAREEIEKKRDSPNFERWLRKKYSFPYEALLSLPAIADASALYDGSETGIARPLGVDATKREKAVLAQNRAIDALLSNQSQTDQSMAELEGRKFSHQVLIAESVTKHQQALLGRKDQMYLLKQSYLDRQVVLKEREVQTQEVKVYFETAKMLGVDDVELRPLLQQRFSHLFPQLKDPPVPPASK